ncbi:MAG: DDE transposase family protein [Microcoleus sp.]|uniref:DDE transposase family protein n=1 Tax=Microcoleus sp. TaxID=44472 RepID=UPI003C74DE7D
MTPTPKYYIVKRLAGNCEILPLAEPAPTGATPTQRIAKIEEQDPTIIDKWGPYDSAEDAIARRIGLIRTGKCQPQLGG